MISKVPIQALHAESPLRVWSLIVTIFGDIVMQQGTTEEPAPIWSGAILQLLKLLQIEPGLARTSLSRLVANKTLVRIKSGRNTFYQLGLESRNAFRIAAQQIYGEVPEATGQFGLVVIDHCNDRQKARVELAEEGYRFIGPTVAIKPIHRGCAPMTLPSQVIASTAELTVTLSSAAQTAWKTQALNAGYKRFLHMFPDFTGTIKHGLDDAIATRVLLVHQYRRLVLRDPLLPTKALPEDWKGAEARKRFMTNLAALEIGSQQWISNTRLLSGKAPTDQD
jgi:phenylacetic acid degradation operon negative regulatory protein